MLFLSPIIRLNIVDLPTLGLPGPGRGLFGGAFGVPHGHAPLRRRPVARHRVERIPYALLVCREETDGHPVDSGRPEYLRCKGIGRKRLCLSLHRAVSFYQ